MKKLKNDAIKLVREFLDERYPVPLFEKGMVSNVQIMIMDIIENASYQTLSRDKDNLMKVFPLDEVAELKFDVRNNKLNTMQDIVRILCIEEGAIEREITDLVWKGMIAIKAIHANNLFLKPRGKEFFLSSEEWLESEKSYIRASIERIIKPLFERLDDDYIANAWGMDVWDELLELPLVKYCYTNIKDVNKDSHDYKVPETVSRFVIPKDTESVSNRFSNMEEKTTIYIKPEKHEKR